MSVTDSNQVSGVCHRTSLKEFPPVTPRDILSVLESDFKDTSCTDKATSQEDICFLQTLENNVVVNTAEHLEMLLPLKFRPYMQKNRQLAVKRLLQLKGHLDREPRYRKQYTEFIEGMLKEGHAEPATEKQGLVK